MSGLMSLYTDKLSFLFYNTKDWKIACIRLKSIGEKLFIDLIKNQKLSYEQASSVLKEWYLGM